MNNSVNITTSKKSLQMKRVLYFLLLFCLLLLMSSAFAGCYGNNDVNSIIRSKLVTYTWVSQSKSKDNQSITFDFNVDGSVNSSLFDYEISGEWTLGKDNTLTMHLGKNSVYSLTFHELTDEEMALGRSIKNGWCVSDKYLMLELGIGDRYTIFTPEE